MEPPLRKDHLKGKNLLLGEPGWSGGAMVLGKLLVPGRPTIWISVGQGPTALAVGAGGGCLDICTFIYPFSPLSPSLWETARYRLKHCLKGPLNPKPTNQPIFCLWSLHLEFIILKERICSWGSKLIPLKVYPHGEGRQK